VVPIDLAGPGEPSAFASSIIVFLIAVLGLGGLMVVALARWRRFRDRAALAERVMSGEPPELAPGYAILKGTVEPEGNEPAVEIAIEEKGHEIKSKAGWNVVWRETSRRVSARPFYLLRATGDAVRVEPDERVFLVDSLTTRDRPSAALRVRVSTLDRGEECAVSGLLRRSRDPRVGGAGYRDAGEALVLTPPRGERMIVSVEPLPDRYLRRAAFHKRAAMGIAALFALVHTLLLGSYYLLVVGGQVRRVTVTDSVSWTTSSKSGRLHHYGLEIAHPSKLGYLQRETGYGAYDAARQASAREAALEVPIRFVHGTDIVQFGEEPRLRLYQTMLTFVALFLPALLYGIASQRTLAWYERKRVIEQEIGRLAAD
jgi:hypothetical protein